MALPAETRTAFGIVLEVLIWSACGRVTFAHVGYSYNPRIIVCSATACAAALIARQREPPHSCRAGVGKLPNFQAWTTATALSALVRLLPLNAVLNLSASRIAAADM